MTDDLTELGRLLEAARKGLGLSAREAARRARLSDTRWRQVVTGVQSRGGQVIQANPSPRTVAAMAQAVGVKPVEALAAAGMEIDPSDVEAMIRDLERWQPKINPPAGLADEIERIRSLPLPPEEKIRVANALIRLYEERAQLPAD